MTCKYYFAHLSHVLLYSVPYPKNQVKEEEKGESKGG
jgi:hypothetical protein